MRLLRLLPIMCALLFTLSRKIDVRVTRCNGITVKINFNIFALVLSEEKIKKKGIKGLTGFFRNVRYALRPVSYLISRSEVIFFKHSEADNTDTSLRTLKKAYLLASAQILISYLTNNAKSIRFITDSYDVGDIKSDADLDFRIRFLLWHLIISSLLFLYYLVKSKIKRGIKNV